VWIPFSASEASRGTYARRRFTPRTGRHRACLVAAEPLHATTRGEGMNGTPVSPGDARPADILALEKATHAPHTTKGKKALPASPDELATPLFLPALTALPLEVPTTKGAPSTRPPGQTSPLRGATEPAEKTRPAPLTRGAPSGMNSCIPPTIWHEDQARTGTLFSR